MGFQSEAQAFLSQAARVLASRLRPQPEGDFDSLSGKFKILMYEDGIDALRCIAMHCDALRCIAVWLGRRPVQTGRFARQAAVFRLAIVTSLAKAHESRDKLY